MLTPLRHLSNDSCGPTKCSSLNGVSSVGQLRTCPGEEINWLETSFGHVVPSSPKPCIRRKLSFMHRTLRRCEAHMQQPCLNAQPQLNIFAHVWIPLSLRGLKHWSIWLERDCFKRALTCFADQNVLMLNLTWQKKWMFLNCIQAGTSNFLLTAPNQASAQWDLDWSLQGLLQYKWE